VVFATRVEEVPLKEKESVARWLLPTAAFAVSFAASTVSVVTMALYFDGAADLKERCPENRCEPELEPERDALSAMGIASMTSFAIGAAAAAAGVVLIFYGPGAKDRAGKNHVRLELAPFMLRGQF
jgi:hypothetical protein